MAPLPLTLWCGEKTVHNTMVIVVVLKLKGGVGDGSNYGVVVWMMTG